ncbi:MAG: DNA-directed RNA polymerase sigma-70 factor [Leptospiraceae bacterium]|nr:MAG: DNA-directed RNA polymerase sigma-70 factor [Leptospiraceae bacterium]
MENKNPEELKELLIQSLEGDQNAYKNFLLEVSKILKSYFSSKVFDQTVVEDLIQETLISIHKARHTYDPSLPVLNWIFAIAYRRYIDYVRKDARIKKYEHSTETFQHISSNLIYKSEEQYDNQNRINSILEHMTEREKKIITLLKIENYSIKEAAKILNLSESALKVAAHRAYKKIKKILKENDL